jgi:outer membrane receptor protein involved in Fe transport
MVVPVALRVSRRDLFYLLLNFTHMNVARTCLAIVMLFLLAGTVSAQTGKIEGRVLDEAGEPLVGVNVFVEGTTRGSSTDIDGYYFILNVRPGTYILLARYIGFNTARTTGVEVSVDRTTSIDFRLTEESLTLGEVVVSADAVRIERDRTSSSSKVTGEQLQVLPVDNFLQAVGLQAGVTRGQGGSLHIRGGRTSEVKYYVDGIAVSNPFNFGLSVPVENTAVQQVEVISGTYNAEFGQANSGIINIVTREGGENLSGTFITSVGSYLSDQNDTYHRINQASPYGIQSYEGSLSGPTFAKQLKFFVNARYTDNQGYLFGRHIFSPSDSSNFSATDFNDWHIEASGDSSTVAMNPVRGLTTMGKLTWDVTRDVKVSYSVTRGHTTAKAYSHLYRLSPFSLPTQFSENWNHLVTLNHVIDNRTFYNLRFTANYTNFQQHKYSDWQDARYRDAFGRNQRISFMFATGGVDNRHINRVSATYAGRFDITRQFGKSHLVKTGFEYRWNELNVEDFSVIVDPFLYGDLTPRQNRDDSRLYSNFTRTPVEISAYIQDKIEIEDLIINIGLRYDYFDPQSRVPTDIRDPDNSFLERPEEEAYVMAKPKQQVSPRVGFAFPITATGVIYASYGQFFQIPEFLRLYENPTFNVRGGTFNTVLGNADLEAQRSVLYEIGLQQQLGDYLAMDLTVYHRDVRFLLGSSLYSRYFGGDSYGRYENKDFGSVRGVTTAFSYADPRSGVNIGLNYTFQSARGNGSDPLQAFFDAQGSNEANAVLIPLDWDTQHNLTTQVALQLQNWNVGVTGEFRTGYPFTPNDIRGQRIVEQRNASRYQSELYFDARLSRVIRIGNIKGQFFMIGENLLGFFRDDRYPPLRDDEIEFSRQNGLERVNTRLEFERNPAIQPSPRNIRAGIQFDF